MKVYFIAIGGSVMHQLAIALKRKGYIVEGSDDEIFEPALGNLAAEGILPATMGWNASNIQKDIDAVILGMHAKQDNPELLAARELGLPVYSFPEYIYKESQHKNRVVIGGSHGKTTTTSMIMHVLRKAQLPFDYLVGAKLDGFDQSVNITDAPLIVCEGDEYPASVIEKRPKFHFLFPHIAVITGIAWDHINVFPTFENYLDQFRIFLDKIEPGGLLIYNETDPVLNKLVNDHPSTVRKKGYGIPRHRIENGSTRIQFENTSTTLKVFGNHNLLNMHAAWLVCSELGLSAETFSSAIASFTGASKRLELLAENDQIRIYRDFAHAPSKVKATMEAVKEQFPSRKLIAVLELHTYSSLNIKFMGEYRGALDAADEAAVFYSKHALELKRLPELSQEEVKEGFGKERLAVFTDRNSLQDWIFSANLENAILLLMSSGNFDGMDLQALAKKIAE